MIFEFTHYRAYLKHKLGGAGLRTGQRKALAEHLKVHTTFVSQVILEKADFSLEQADSANAYFGHSPDESEYFLWLVLKDRAGTKELKARWDEKIQQMRAKYLNIGERLDHQGEVSLHDQARFYSSYLYAAIHVLVSIPDFQSIEALAKLLNRSHQEISEKIQFLIRIGLVVEDAGRLRHGNQHIHLSADSHLINQHHCNWRLRAMHSIENPFKNDLHYSAAVTLSMADTYTVKNSIIKNLQENIKTISSSKEEVAYVYNIDFFLIT
jgi:uncharacterized protein (TIGR02147 family)